MATQRFNPGPIDGSVLTLQHQHRSTSIWNKNDPGIINIRQRSLGLQRSMPNIDNRMRQYLISSGFYGLHCLQYIQLDHALITALLERWRQETHTFHLAVGEATVTLQDVGVLLGLPIDGLPIISESASISPTSVCERYLGVRPPQDMFRGQCVKMKWLAETFSHLPENADDTMVQQYTRAYILQLIAGILFANRKENMVHLKYLAFLKDLKKAGEYSWGSAALAWLYNQLCKATNPEIGYISGAFILLQLWAWDRFPHMCPTRKSTARPVPAGLPKEPLGCRWCVELSKKNVSTNVLWVYRDQLDQQKANQMIWEPYAKVMHELPNYCVSGSRIWRSKCPLICFDIVELHFPDRVLRQFGLLQEIPSPCDTQISLHDDRYGRVNAEWLKLNGAWISMWDKRHELIVEGKPSKNPMRKDDPYMLWYSRITRRFIGPLDDGASQGYGARYASMGQVLQNIIDQAKSALISQDGPAYENFCRFVITVGELEMNRYHGFESNHDKHEDASMQPVILPIDSDLNADSNTNEASDANAESDEGGDGLEVDSSDKSYVASSQATPCHGSASLADPSQGGSNQSVSSEPTTSQHAISRPTTRQTAADQPSADQPAANQPSADLPAADQSAASWPTLNEEAVTIQEASERAAAAALAATRQAASGSGTAKRIAARLAAAKRAKDATISRVTAKEAAGQPLTHQPSTGQFPWSYQLPFLEPVTKRAATGETASTANRDPAKRAATSQSVVSQPISPQPIASQAPPNYQVPFSGYFPMPFRFPPMMPSTPNPNLSGETQTPYRLPFFWPYPMHPAMYSPMTPTHPQFKSDENEQLNQAANKTAPEASKKETPRRNPGRRAKRSAKD